MQTGITCGGTILNKDTILSAAHCCESMTVGDHVLAGEHDLDKEENTTQVASVTDFINHPNYYKTPSLTAFNDVCIVKLKKPLKMNKYVKAVKLPDCSEIDFDGNAAISGWGRTKNNGESAKKLQVAKVPLVNFSTCVNDYAHVEGFPQEDVDLFQESLMICAGIGGEDTCQGDSGGPLMCGDVICGITSFGAECGSTAGVYARVSNYLDFILKYLYN